jgi:hypothetical protein
LAEAGVIRSVVEFSPRDFRVESAGPVADYTLADCPRWNRPGAPSVPFRTVYVAIPEGESVVAVQVEAAPGVDLGRLPAPPRGTSRAGADIDPWDGRTPWPQASFTTGDAG